jgi:hypothetical protein
MTDFTDVIFGPHFYYDPGGAAPPEPRPGISIDGRWTVFDENRIYFLGASNFPAVMEKNGGNLTVRPMGRKATWNMATGGAAGAVDVGTHYYQIITVDKFGNRSSPYADDDSYIAIDIPDTSNDQVDLTGISIGGSGDKKYIYRTKANASIDDPDNPMVYYLVDTIDDNQVSYPDVTADADIIGNAILSDVESYPPQDLAYATVHNGVMWGFTENSSILRYSNQFGYEQWPVTNAIPVGDPDYLTAVVSVGDHLLLFKKNRIYAFWGTNIHNFDYREISSNFGTIYIDTIKPLGNNRAIFLDSQKRVIMYDGNGFTEISKPIKIPTPVWYTATLYKDYYMLWIYLPYNYDPDGDYREGLPIIQWMPRDQWFREGEGADGGGGTVPIDPPGGDPGEPPQPPEPPVWDPGEDVRYEWENYPGLGPQEPPKGPREQIPQPGWTPPYRSAKVMALAYHIPSGAWSSWDDIQMLIPEKPDRSVDNFAYWNGNCMEVLGKAAREEDCRWPDFVVRSVDTDCGASNQEKSFKEIEIYLEYTDNRSFNGVVGQLELFVDEGTSPVWQQTITFDTDELQRRWRYRIRSGQNGTRASIKFIGNQNMNRFSLMGGRLWWEPRGTARRSS